MGLANGGGRGYPAPLFVFYLNCKIRKSRGPRQLYHINLALSSYMALFFEFYQNKYQLNRQVKNVKIGGLGKIGKMGKIGKIGVLGKLTISRIEIESQYQ